MNAPLETTFLPALERELAAALDGEVDFSKAARALYAVDASNYRQIPLGTVQPRHADDIERTLAIAHRAGVPVLMRGGGTSQNGQCVNEALVLDCSRHLREVLDIDVAARTATVQPGVVCDALKAAAEVHGLTFGPDPATHGRCTLGGMIGNNSCGPHSMLAGKTVENVLELDVLTADGTRLRVGPTGEAELERIVAGGGRRGEIYAELRAIRDEYADEIRARFPGIKRRVSGYNLDQLLPENGFDVARALVGSEGTCVSVLQARVRLIENPARVQLVVLGFDDVYTAGDAVVDILPFEPIAMEGLDWNIVGGLEVRGKAGHERSRLPDGRAWLLVEIAANDDAALESRTEAFVDAMQRCTRVRSVLAVHGVEEVAGFWRIREQGASATSMSLDPDGVDPVVGWEDTAVDPLRIGDYLRGFQALVDRYGYTTSLYGHFGDGCIHARITFDTRTAAGVAHWRAFSVEMAKLVVEYGGSLSGEHGDGQAKAEFLPVMFGERLMQAFRRFKAAWDPDGRMNPGKLIDAYRMDENLRFGPDYVRPQPVTVLHFAEDPAGFGRSMERCIGMGKCRTATGAMCPSYQASGEERHSTRGRAHLLHEMLRGEIITDGFDDTDIADSLEHCLACKACKSACPTQVDIATYKAEFMHAHYRRRRRPIAHRLLGHVGDLLPWMSRLPRVTNALLGGPTGGLVKRVMGFAAEVTLPRVASEPFSVQARRMAGQREAGMLWFGDTEATPVVLWADSLNAHYRPEVLVAAVRVLNASGLRVGVARERFCCGRPFHDLGLLEQARQRLKSILDGFVSELPDGAAVVVLESSCRSMFRDDLLRLLPDDARASELSARVTGLAELLERHEVRPVRRLPHGVLHLHCHDKASGDALAERALLQACFESLEEPEPGCCGMAGSYGLKRETRVLGQRLFDRALGPALADGDASGAGQKGEGTVVVASGFSCAEQIGSRSVHRALHPAQVLERCLV